MLRSEWDIVKYVRTGGLVMLLDAYATEPADIFAVYSERQARLPRVRVFTGVLVKSFAQGAGKSQALGLRWQVFARVPERGRVERFLR